MTLPYRITPVFDQDSLPDALREAHVIGEGELGVIQVLEGELRFVTVDSMCEQILRRCRPGMVAPRQLHFVEPLGKVRMQVEFYDTPPTS